jgi:hypothetical protein
MIKRIVLLSLLLTQVPASNAVTSPPPTAPPPPLSEPSGWKTWEIALAAGSGGVAILLLLYAFMMRPRKKEEAGDVEAGKKTQANDAPYAKAKVVVDKKGERIGPALTAKTPALAAKTPALAAKTPALAAKTPALAAKTKSGKVNAPKSTTGKMLAAASLKKAPPPSPSPPKPTVKPRVKSLPPARKGSL